VQLFGSKQIVFQGVHEITNTKTVIDDKFENLHAPLYQLKLFWPTGTNLKKNPTSSILQTVNLTLLIETNSFLSHSNDV